MHFDGWASQNNRLFLPERLANTSVGRSKWDVRITSHFIIDQSNVAPYCLKIEDKTFQPPREMEHANPLTSTSGHFAFGTLWTPKKLTVQMQGIWALISLLAKQAVRPS